MKNTFRIKKKSEPINSPKRVKGWIFTKTPIEQLSTQQNQTWLLDSICPYCPAHPQRFPEQGVNIETTQDSELCNPVLSEPDIFAIFNRLVVRACEECLVCYRVQINCLTIPSIKHGEIWIRPASTKLTVFKGAHFWSFACPYCNEIHHHPEPYGPRSSLMKPPCITPWDSPSLVYPIPPSLSEATAQASHEPF
jgi:hypothetical protein